MDELVADAAKNPQLDSGDIALPYLYVLQTNNPQVNPAKEQFIPGATAGMIYNTVLNEVYEGRKEGIIVIPCAYERRLVEWVDRDAGGGWVRDWPLDSDIMTKTHLNAKNKPCLDNGNVIVETAYHYSLFQNPEEGQWSQCVIPMKSTFLKKNRKWNNIITTSKIPGTETTAPRYLYAYQLTTEVESKGENSWFVPDMKKIESPVEVALYRMAKKFAEMVNEGVIRRTVELPDGDVIDSETGEVL
jgi:hypothetical protein